MFAVGSSAAAFAGKNVKQISMTMKDHIPLVPKSLRFDVLVTALDTARRVLRGGVSSSSARHRHNLMLAQPYFVLEAP
jgi:hypothetical protein